MKILLLTAFLLAIVAPRCQGSNSENDKELSAGQADFARHDYDDAAKHFKKASKLEHESCSECFIWLLRAEIGLGKTDDALKSADMALKTAQSDRQRANAQLYRAAERGQGR